MLFTFLLVVQAVIATLLVGVILVQKSEGGGLTSGGSPTGLMSARGAADFLTRSTAILATLFITLSIVLGILAANQHSAKVDTTLQKQEQAAPAAQPTPAEQPVALPTSTLPGNSSTSVLPSLGQLPTDNSSQPAKK